MWLFAKIVFFRNYILLLKHFNITVFGKVQGVFFRASTVEIAKQLCLSGFVRNLPDGNVYIEAEGEEKQIAKFVKWCHQGPTRAVVSKVDISEHPPLKIFSDFVIYR